MPVSDDRKIISLAALTEFKTKQDTYNASKFVPYQNATGPVNLGEYGIYASEFSDSAQNTGGGRIYFYEGSLNISSVADVAVTTGNGSIFTYNGVEVATKADISRAYKTKGSATTSELETLAAGNTLENGDVYNVGNNGTLDNVGPTHAQDVRVNAGDNVVWIVPASPATPYWDILAGTTDFVTNSALSTALAGYLPLNGGTMNGSITMSNSNIYMNDNSINQVNSVIFGSSSNTFGRISYGRTSGSEATGWLKFWSDNAKYHFASEDASIEAILSLTNLETASRTYHFPDESGTLVVGEYATTGAGGDIERLFN